MSTIKQVIVVRKDLNMRKGKIAAQAAHASMAVILNQMKKASAAAIVSGEQVDVIVRELVTTTTSCLEQWLSGSFTKVCVCVDSEQQLLDVYKSAQSAGLLCSLITDSGKTEFNGVPTNTVVAIGPDFSEKIDVITGNLKLM